MSKRATVVCCYNDYSLFESMKNSLEHQTEQVEIIGIDNTKNKYSSCSCAFNSVLPNVNTEYVIFSHQDILFDEQNCVENYLNYCSSIGDYDLLGVVGKVRGNKFGTGNIRQGSERNWAVKQRLKGIQECESFDECFFGGKTCCFKEYPFSETLCPGWHLYAVERCVAAKARGNRAYICDVSLLHLSGGKTDHAYNITFYNISKYYSAKIDYIATTCEEASTRFPRREAAYIKRELHVLKRDLRGRRN